jgi:hypothetical protein
MKFLMTGQEKGDILIQVTSDGIKIDRQNNDEIVCKGAL